MKKRLKKNNKPYKIPTDNYPIQTLVNMSLNPSRPSSSEVRESFCTKI